MRCKKLMKLIGGRIEDAKNEWCPPIFEFCWFGIKVDCAICKKIQHGIKKDVTLFLKNLVTSFFMPCCIFLHIAQSTFIPNQQNSKIGGHHSFFASSMRPPMSFISFLHRIAHQIFAILDMILLERDLLF